MEVIVERKDKVERIVIDLRNRQVLLESGAPEPLAILPLDKKLHDLLKQWLSEQATIKEVSDAK